MIILDKASKQFIEQAINFLQMATDQYGKVSKDKIEVIRNVIEELEEVLYG